jgi:hypothetical protein
VSRVADEPQRIQFDWLNRLRFCAIAGQLTTIVVVEHFLDVRLFIGALAAVVGVELVMNLACLWRARRPAPIGEGVLCQYSRAAFGDGAWGTDGTALGASLGSG